MVVFMVKRNRNGEKWVYFALGLALGIFIVFLFTSINPSSGDEVTKSIVVQYEGTDDTSGGFIQLLRNNETPSVLDWATFENGKTSVFFTIENGETYSQILTINVPQNVDRGTYYLDYYVEFVDGQKEEKTLSFFVG